MNGKIKAIAIIAIFTIFYLCFGLFNWINLREVNDSQDFNFHWNRINGIDSRPEYPPLYHIIFSVFSIHPLIFYTANTIMITTLLPLILFTITKKWWTVAIYFCGVPLAHQLLYGATYPQALILVFVALYLWQRKNWFVLLLLTAAAAYTHNLGLILFAVIWVIEASSIFVNEYIKKHREVVLIPGQITGVTGMLKLAILQLPLPILFFSIKGWSDSAMGMLAIFSIFAGIQDIRTLLIAQLIFTIFASNGIGKSSKKIQTGFIIFLAAQLTFYLLDFALGTWKIMAWN